MRYLDKTQVNINQPVQTKSSNGGISLNDLRGSSVLQQKQVAALTNKQTADTVVQKEANTTGLPDQLKSGIENLSGHSMDDVKVHYNSRRPAFKGWCNRRFCRATKSGKGGNGAGG